MNTLYEKAETGCCLRFNPEPWDEKEVTWKDMLFLRDHVKCFLHIPLNFGKMMVKNMEIIQGADALAPSPIMLTYEKSPWGIDVYIAVGKEVPGAKMEKISGTFMTRVFEGHYKNAGKWVKQMKAYTKSKGKEIKKLYFFYTTCPSCAKYYGKNYTVLVAQI